MVARALVWAGVPTPGDQRTSRHFTTRWQTPGRNDANTVALGSPCWSPWDVTVVRTLALTSLPQLEDEATSYAEISTAYTFLPIAVETLGPMNESAYRFFEDLGRRICEVTVTFAKYLSSSSGSQSPFNASMRLSIVRHSLCTTIRTSGHSTFVFSVFFRFNPCDLYYQGY